MKGPAAAAFAVLLSGPTIVLADAGEAARLTGGACPMLSGARGKALVAISGKPFEGRAAIATDGRTIAIGEPDGRCLVFAARDPDDRIGKGEMNVVREPDAPLPSNTRTPLLLAAVLDPPLAPFLASRGTLHVTRSAPALDATFRLELDHGEVSLTVMGRFSIPAEE